MDRTTGALVTSSSLYQVLESFTRKVHSPWPDVVSEPSCRQCLEQDTDAPYRREDRKEAEGEERRLRWTQLRPSHDRILLPLNHFFAWLEHQP